MARKSLTAEALIPASNQRHLASTGAGMWLAAAIGLASGLGLWPLTVMACVLAALVLALVRTLETRLQLKPPKQPPDGKEGG